MRSPETPELTSLESLHVEMGRVRFRIRDRENDLGKRWNRLPEETVKSAVGAILPMLIGNGLASGAWKLAKGAIELIKGKKNEEQKNGGSKNALLAGASKLGIFTALKLLFNLWRGK